MQKLTKDHLFSNRGDLSTVPSVPPLKVAQGESFLIETVDGENKNIMSEKDIAKPGMPMARVSTGDIPWTGPVYVDGIRAGDVIAVVIEDIKVMDHCFIQTGNEEFFVPTLLPSELVKKRKDFISISDGMAHFPGGFGVPIHPMFGCFGVVPLKSYADPWYHGGNMDIPDICAGNIVHIPCERDGAFFACGDGHAVQGEGEINGFSLEVSLQGQFHIERSGFQGLKTIMIETPDEFIAVGIMHEMEGAVKAAVYSMSDLLARRKGVDLLEAYQLVSHIGDLRLGATWPMWCKKWHIAVPVCLHLSKRYFH